MILGYVNSKDLTIVPFYSLEFTQEEFDKVVLKGESIKHETACAEISGVWEVKFKKNSKAKHKKLMEG